MSWKLFFLLPPKKAGLKYLLISSLFLLQHTSVYKIRTASSTMPMNSLLPSFHQLLCNFSHNSFNITVHKSSQSQYALPQFCSSNHICCIVHTHTQVLGQSATCQRQFSVTNDWFWHLAHVFLGLFPYKARLMQSCSLLAPPHYNFETTHLYFRNPEERGRSQRSPGSPVCTPFRTTGC